MIYTVYLNPTIDKTLYFDSFEAGKTNRPKKTVIDGAGKAINVAVVLRELKERVCCIGLLRKNDGDIIKKRLSACGAEYDFIEVEGNSRVNTKIFDGQKREITEINESGEEFSRDILDRAFKKTVCAAQNGDIFILTGSLPKGADSGLYADMTRALKEKGAKVILDADGEALKTALCQRPYFIKPNIDELSAIETPASDGVKDVAECAAGICGKYACIAAVSMGGRGALITDGKESFFAPPLKLEVRSTVGAGDSMVAGIVYGVKNKLSLDKMLEYGAACAGCSITKEGTRLADGEGIEKLRSEVVTKRI